MDTIEVNGTEGVMDQDPVVEIAQNGVDVEEPTPSVEQEADAAAPTYAELSHHWVEEPSQKGLLVRHGEQASLHL
jgi:hypothetical protein